LYYSRIESIINKDRPNKHSIVECSHHHQHIFKADESDESDDDTYCYIMFDHFGLKCSIVRDLNS